MRQFAAFTKKEFLESLRTGKCMILGILFVLFGIMNPAIAKLTPWMMGLFADAMAESGIIIGEMQVDAMTSWTQFFKNIPMALIAFVLIYSDILTKEYKSGSLLPVLTKGLPRVQILLAKSAVLSLFWTLGYWLCFGITYGYNAFFWDNSIAVGLLPAALGWWLFGWWVLCLVILFSTLLQSGTEVILCTGGTTLLVYVLGFLPKVRAFTPTRLMETAALLSGAAGADTIQRAATAAVLCGVLCVAVSIPVMNKKQL